MTACQQDASSAHACSVRKSLVAAIVAEGGSFVAVMMRLSSAFPARFTGRTVGHRKKYNGNRPRGAPNLAFKPRSFGAGAASPQKTSSKNFVGTYDDSPRESERANPHHTISYDPI
jgi:hypothetical protein